MKLAMISPALVCLAVCLSVSGCRSKKVVVDENSSDSLIDTTHVSTDSLSMRLSLSDSSQVIMNGEQSVTVNFVEGGGTVSVECSGNVTLTGVRAVNGRHLSHGVRTSNMAMTEEVERSHVDTDSGIIRGTRRVYHADRDAGVNLRSVIARFVWLCCIAVLLWLLFLYLKRKL